MIRHLRLHAACTLALLTPAALGSAVFDGDFASYWLVNEETGQLTSYSSGSWIDSYSGSVYQPGSNEQVLVNRLPQSSVPMSGSQAAVSLIGLERADKRAGESGGLTLEIAPASGSYSETIRVNLDASAANGSADRLQWRINGGAWQSLALSTEVSGTTLTLIENGSYDIEAQLLSNGTLTGSAQALYLLANDDPYGQRRDSDGDGIPDIVEAAIGLNALQDDITQDSDSDGWSDADTWLRCGVTTREEADKAGCKQLDDDDEDGWSNFDENLRGTRSDDPVVTLPAPEPGTTAYFDAQQAYRDVPAARRLYEREYVTPRQELSTPVTRLSATTTAGDAVYDSDALLSAADLELAGLNSGDVEAHLLQTHALELLGQAQLTHLRLPASDGAFIRAAAVNDIPVRLTYLVPRGDIHWADYMPHAGDWNSAEEWRAGFTGWLGTQLTIRAETDLNSTASLDLLILEQALKEEARRLNVDRQLRLGDPQFPLRWISDWLSTRQQRFGVSGLADAVSALTTTRTTQPDGALSQDYATIAEWISQQPAQTPLSEWLNQQLYQAHRSRLNGCFISDYELSLLQADADAFAAFQERCPEYYTGTDVATERASDAELRMRLSMTLIPGALAALSADATLGDSSADSDSDGLSNLEELSNYSLASMPLPWLSDTDADNAADGADLCPADALDRCAGFPKMAVVNLEDTEAISTQRLAGETTLLAGLRLDRPATSAVCVSYDITSQSGSPGINDSGEVCFAQGQQVALIAVTLPDDGEGAAASLLLTLTDSTAQLGTATQLELRFEENDTDLRPQAMIETAASELPERDQLVLDGSDSRAHDDSPLSFNWSQIAGPTLTLPPAPGNTLSLTLPEVLSNTTLGFRLTVTDIAGRENSADISLVVLPVEDAPEQLNVPAYAMSAGGTLDVTTADLGLALREPDGDPLNFGEVSGLPQGVSVSRDGDVFTFTADTGGGTIELADRRSRSLVRWGDGVAFITMSDDENPFAIWGWQPGAGTAAEELVTAPEGATYSDLLGNSETDMLYFDSYNQTSGGLDIFRFDGSDTDTVSTTDYGSLYGAAVSHTGQLYYCGYGGNWQIVDYSSGSLNDSGFSCDTYGSYAANVGDRICMTTTNDQVVCSAGNGDPSLSLIYTAAPDTTSMGRLFSFNGELIITRNLSRVEGGFLAYYSEVSRYSVASGDLTTVGEVPLQQYDMRVQVSDNTLWITGQGLASYYPNLMTYRLDAGATALTQVSDDLLGDLVSPSDPVSLMGMVVDGSTPYVTAQVNYRDILLLRVNPDGSTAEITPDNLSGRVLPYNDQLLLAINQPAGEGICDWFSADSDGGLAATPVFANASCYTAMPVEGGIVFERRNADTGNSIYTVFTGSGPAGTYRLTLPVDDGKGNTIDMEFDLEVQP